MPGIRVRGNRRVGHQVRRSNPPLLEHLGLDSTGEESHVVLAAGGGVEGENQTPPRAGRNTRRSTKFFHERIDRSALIGSCTTCSLKTRSGMDFPSRGLTGPPPPERRERPGCAAHGLQGRHDVLPRPAEMGPQASLNQQIYGVTEQILQPQA